MQEDVTSPPTFATLLRELLSEVSADWENIGLFLGLKPGNLDSIKYNNQQAESCLREMLKLWLKQVNPLPTWSAITEALNLLEHQSLAERLREKYTCTCTASRYK